MQVVPETTGHDMPQRIRKVVGHHFRVSSRTGGEIHQRDIVIAIWVRRADERSGVLDTLLEILETFRYFRPYGYNTFTVGESGKASMICFVITSSPAQTIILISAAFAR